MDLKNKTLLLIGGGTWKEALKGFSDYTGVKLVACGNDKTGGIFSVASEAYVVDSTDSDGVKKVINDNDIDGVYIGGSETVINAACQYLEELDMPCYCNKTQWGFIQNKSKLKEKFIEFGIPVAPRYNITYDEIESCVNDIDFPVITKPTDGCGSNGFSICNNICELKKGYEFAMKNSLTGEVMVEKLVNNKGVVVVYTFTNGEMVFSGLEDKYPIQYAEDGSFVVGMLVFESRFTKEFREKFDNKLSAMFKDIGIKEGTIWIEVFHDGDDYYFNEAGYRYGGSVTVYPVDYFYNINQVYSDMYYALTGTSKIYGWPSLIPDDKRGKKHYAIYPIYVTDGIIGDVQGVESIKNMPEVITLIQSKAIGTIVEKTGNFSQNFGMVHFVFDTKDEFYEIVNKVNAQLCVNDTNGKNMIMSWNDNFFEEIVIC